jgi:hypothetical protein
MATAPNLSTRCPKCGDNASMPSIGIEPQLTKRRASLKYDRHADLFAALHLCPNDQCLGSTIGYYTLSSSSRSAVNPWQYEFHTPEYHARTVSSLIPERPRKILQEAHDTRTSPVACAAMTVRAVEAMLAELKVVKPNGLKGRIEKAVAKDLLPQVMADWAEEIREIGNDSHTDSADDPDPLPDSEEAARALMFADTLADYLFVLPTQIQRARGKDE